MQLAPNRFWTVIIWPPKLFFLKSSLKFPFLYISIKILGAFWIPLYEYVVLSEWNSWTKPVWNSYPESSNCTSFRFCRTNLNVTSFENFQYFDLMFDCITRIFLNCSQYAMCTICTFYSNYKSIGYVWGCIKTIPRSQESYRAGTAHPVLKFLNPPLLQIREFL